MLIISIQLLMLVLLHLQEMTKLTNPQMNSNTIVIVLINDIQCTYGTETYNFQTLHITFSLSYNTTNQMKIYTLYLWSMHHYQRLNCFAHTKSFKVIGDIILSFVTTFSLHTVMLISFYQKPFAPKSTSSLFQSNSIIDMKCT